VKLLNAGSEEGIGRRWEFSMQKILLLTQQARNGDNKGKRLSWDGKKQVRKNDRWW